MKVDVLAFGIARDIVGKNKISLELDGMTTTHLKEILEIQYPKLKNISSYMIAINSEYASEEMQLNEGDEIAIIPPVSGG